MEQSPSISASTKQFLSSLGKDYARNHKDKETLHLRAEEQDFFVIGSGQRREVFCNNDYPGIVFKVCRTDKPYANIKEIETYEEFGDQTTALAPILDYGDDKQWLIMPKVTPDHSARKPVLDQLREDDIRCKDVNHGNVGRLPDGTPVLFDYDWKCESR